METEHAHECQPKQECEACHPVVCQRKRGRENHNSLSMGMGLSLSPSLSLSPHNASCGCFLFHFLRATDVQLPTATAFGFAPPTPCYWDFGMHSRTKHTHLAIRFRIEQQSTRITGLQDNRVLKNYTTL